MIIQGDVCDYVAGKINGLLKIFLWFSFYIWH